MPVPNALIAYVGPGADLGLISYALSLIVFGITAFSAVLLWPVYALLRRIRGAANKPALAPPVDDAPGNARAMHSSAE